MKIKKTQKENRLTNNMCKCAYFHVLCPKLEAAVAGSLFGENFYMQNIFTFLHKETTEANTKVGQVKSEVC